MTSFATTRDFNAMIRSWCCAMAASRCSRSASGWKRPPPARACTGRRRWMTSRRPKRYDTSSNPPTSKTQVIPEQRLEYRFGDRTARVQFITTADGTTVRVTFEAETTHSVAQQQEGWQAILDNFARHVTGDQHA